MVSGTTIPGTENADATFKGENVDLHVVASVQGFKIDFTGHGKYKLNGDKYSVNFGSVDLATKMNGNAELETTLKSGLQQYLNKDANGTLQWKDDRTVTIAFDGGQTMTLTRQ